MAKRIDPVTGKEEEISEEEFWSAINSGEAKIQRVEKIVTDSQTGVEIGRMPLGGGWGDDFLLGLLGDKLSFDAKLEAAKAGDIGSMVEVANAYLNGDEVDEDYEEAFKWFLKAAESDNEIAQFNVGLFYAKGFVVERDLEKAAEWMDRADENGDEDAAGCAEQYRAVLENRKKAEAGDTDAAAELAEYYMASAGSLNQAGTGTDYEESLRWAKIAAAAKKAKGYYALGLAYTHGRGVDADAKKAAEYFKKGAELGHPDSMCNYAICILNGDVSEKTDEDAFELMLRSAELGYPQAMYNVGHCYQFGNGVDDDMHKAIEWYEKYLEVHPDEELEDKVRFFKMLLGEESVEERDALFPDFDSFEPLMEEMIAYAESKAPEKGRTFTIDTDLDVLIGFVRELSKNGDDQAKRIMEKLENHSLFQQLTADSDEHAYDDDDETDDEVPDDELPGGFDMMEAFSQLMEYAGNLEESEGISTDDLDLAGMIELVKSRAQTGDEEAKRILPLLTFGME